MALYWISKTHTDIPNIFLLTVKRFITLGEFEVCYVRIIFQMDLADFIRLSAMSPSNKVDHVQSRRIRES